MDLVAASGATRRRIEPPAEEGNALAHPDESVSTAAAVHDADPVVLDGHIEQVGSVCERDDRARRAGVAQHVRQRLLDDAVRGEIDAWRKIPRLPMDDELRLEAGAARALDERPEVTD